MRGMLFNCAIMEAAAKMASVSRYPIPSGICSRALRIVHTEHWNKAAINVTRLVVIISKCGVSLSSCTRIRLPFMLFLTCLTCLDKSNFEPCNIR